MGEEKLKRGSERDRERIEAARNFLCGYRLCLDMLDLRRYERKRAYRYEEECNCSDILSGSVAYWKGRIREVEEMMGAMKNSREKLMLYYHYVRGESVEHVSGFLTVSRRTGYRLLERGLLMAADWLERTANLR